ncbi:hypothetical protein LX64_02177 [Chitinophaga skermanii]|uniref:Uncharacterized protein n=1 Tax=Chitinophaga skermanii TaxID=331697 RepID=A0A327QNW2_9BACT|nr:hypothetical protein [Chitinophaga skermanii]RAJ05023.1 hypothetical protein LX64_02177 [Chitinophaga skermanii]
MKLRFETTSTYFSHYHYTQTVQRRTVGIHTAASAKEEEFDIYACNRNLGGASFSLGLKHCYLSAKKGNTTVNSASFSSTQQGTPDMAPDHASAVCTKVGTMTMARFQQMAKQFEECGKYSVTSNNCCSCTYKVLQLNGITPPDTVCGANMGVGIPTTKK